MARGRGCHNRAQEWKPQDEEAQVVLLQTRDPFVAQAAPEIVKEVVEHTVKMLPPQSLEETAVVVEQTVEFMAHVGDGGERRGADPHFRRWHLLVSWRRS